MRAVAELKVYASAISAVSVRRANPEIFPARIVKKWTMRQSIRLPVDLYDRSITVRGGHWKNRGAWSRSTLLPANGQLVEYCSNVAFQYAGRG